MCILSFNVKKNQNAASHGKMVYFVFVMKMTKPIYRIDSSILGNNSKYEGKAVFATLFKSTKTIFNIYLHQILYKKLL